MRTAFVKFMNIGISVLAFLFISSLMATVLAASTSSVNISNSINANSTTSSNSNTSSNTTSTSTCNARVENHITVEVNGEKKQVDDVKEGCSVNSNIKVDAKSENGKTSFNISGNPQSVKDVKGDADNQNTDKSKVASTSSNQTPSSETKKTPESFWAGFSNFFKGIFAFFHFFSR